MPEHISVLIPAYNAERYLGECIQSVLDQSLTPAEIIVIDDGSDDRTAHIAETYGPPVRCLRVPHGGLPYARNHGIREARGDIVAFIDSDDIWLPQKLELQMAALQSRNGPAMLFGRVQQFVSRDLAPEEAAKLKCSPEPLSGFLPSTLLIRKSDIHIAGLFDETISTGEFIEWCSRARDAGVTSLIIPEVVCQRRLHLTNMGRGGKATHSQYLQMLKKVIDRRRDQAT